MSSATRGTVLAGRYRLEERLHSSADGALWLAVDSTLERRVSIRVMRPAHPYAADVADAARRAALIDDDRLVRVLDVGTDRDIGFVVSEYVDGDTLATLVERSPLAPAVVRRIIGEVSQGLERAAGRGLHHLRLTPRSVIVCRDGTVKVEGTAVEAAAVGLEPDHAETANRIDAIALIGLLYSGLTGRWPLGDAGFPPAPRGEGGNPIPPADLVPGIPNDLDTLCVVTLGVADDGPLSPAELAAELAPWPSAEAAPLRSAPRRAPIERAAPREPEALPKISHRPTPKSGESLPRAGSVAALPGGAPGILPGGFSFDPPRAGPNALSKGKGSRPDQVSPTAHDAAEPTDTEVPGTTGPERIVDGMPVVDISATPGRARNPSGQPQPTPNQPPPNQTGVTVPALKGRPTGRKAPQSGVPAGSAPAGSTPAGSTSAGSTPAGSTLAGSASPIRPTDAGGSGRANRAYGSEPMVPWGTGWPSHAAPPTALESTGPFPIVIPPEAPPREQSRLVLFSIAAVLLLGLVVAAWSLRDLGGSSDAVVPTGGRTLPTASAPAPTPDAATPPPTAPAATTPVTPEPVAVRIAAIRAIDPQGDGDEDTASSPLAVDGDPSTFWGSETYRTEAFGGLKDGVGLAILLAEEAAVSSVSLDVGGTGGAVEVRTAASPDIAASTVVGSSEIVNGTATIETSSAEASKYVILWFTKLPTVGGKFTIEVSEVRLK